MNGMKIDAHQHFWRYSEAEYPWIPKNSPLHRDWLPSDLAALQTPLGFDASIAVQARQTVAESDWLLGLADGDPGVERDLERLARHPKFVGVRHVVQDEPDDDFMLRPEFLRGVSRLKSFGLIYDFLVYPRQLRAAIEVAARFPEQPFVLDHLAKPSVRTGGYSEWAAQIRELARCPNVVCKISGLVTEADHKAWAPDDLRPVLEIACDAFGPQRLLFGSDWPVCLLAASYERVFALIDDFTRSWSPADRDALFGSNAARVYGLGR
jgi:L-fuconolactonase